LTGQDEGSPDRADSRRSLLVDPYSAKIGSNLSASDPARHRQTGRRDIEITVDKRHLVQEYTRQAEKREFGYKSSLPSTDRGLLAKILRPSDTVLDAGCGQGALLETLGKLIAPRGTIIRIDLSIQMLLLAEKAARDTGCTFHLVRADVERLPLKHSSIDASISSLSLHRMNPQKSLEEMYRALKPSRYMIVTLPYSHDED